MEIEKFRVELRQVANGLTAHVDVISLTQSHAKRMAVRVFFKNGWEVTNCTKI